MTDIVLTGIDTDNLPSIQEQHKRDLNRPGRPPLCIDCHYVVKNTYHGTGLESCLHPLNYKGVNLVDGSRVLKEDKCMYHRSTRNPELCGITGKWFKPVEFLPPIITKTEVSNITRPNFKSVKLTEEKLGNL